MNIKSHNIKEDKIAELLSDKLIIKDIQDGIDLLGNLYFQGYDKVIIHKQHISPEFFELKNKMAGEILQKFSTYRVRLFIIGNFTDISSKSLKDFIFESNKGKQVNFLSSVPEVFQVLSNS